ncbi:unnamed protein product [Nesidiocoris tenuis]|uniref:Uncharacterized protein n=1 Tax=Nesidiocoris tenuis TaxID=355587 RepID=A0A6H5HQ95_9HEMI|nr:unnamed protein product [Nesidiocoris tenuis]
MTFSLFLVEISRRKRRLSEKCEPYIPLSEPYKTPIITYVQGFQPHSRNLVQNSIKPTTRLGHTISQTNPYILRTKDTGKIAMSPAWTNNTEQTDIRMTFGIRNLLCVMYRYASLQNLAQTSHRIPRGLPSFETD